MPGIFAQTVIFGATITGAGMADDMQKGIIDRFRSLPMSRSAVLVGRTGSDVINNVLVMVIMSLTGLLVGWRIRTSFGEAVGGFLLLLAFAYAICWVMALRRPDGAEPGGGQQRLVHGHLPADVRREHVRADEQLPARAEDVRRLEPGVLGDPGGASVVRQHQRQAAAARTTGRCGIRSSTRSIWVAILLAIFVPLSSARYKKAASR